MFTNEEIDFRYYFEPNLYEMPITFNEGVGCRLDTRQIAHFDELQNAFAFQRARQVELND